MEGGFQSMCNLSQGIEKWATERGLKRGLEQGLEQGLEKGLSALVHTLKEFISDFDTLYAKVIQNKDFESVTKEEVLKYY